MAFPEIPGYEIEEQIGRGGMGIVYKARHLALDRPVALKVLHSALCGDEEFVRSFAQEAKIIARLTHPNIVSVYDFGNHEGVYYLSLQYVQGKTVAEVIGTRKLSLQETGTIILQVAEALDFAHRNEVVHRDIKPGNIMLCNDGKAMVMDFGVASASYNSGANSVWVAAGSPAYMSPEQCRGLRASPRSDQYSLGVTVYEMIAGRLPFTEMDPGAAMRQQISETPPPLGRGRLDINPRLEAAVMRTLSKMPEMRFTTVGAFAQELDAACREAPRSAVEAAPAPAIGGGTLGGLGRAPVSLVDGPVAAAPAARPDPMQGYVFKSAGYSGPSRRPSWVWLVILLLVGGIGAAAYLAFFKPPARTSQEKPKSTVGMRKTSAATRTSREIPRARRSARRTGLAVAATAIPAARRRSSPVVRTAVESPSPAPAEAPAPVTATTSESALAYHDHEDPSPSIPSEGNE